MADIDARLEQLQAQNSAANIPTLARQQKLSELYTEMLASKENKESAPERYKNAYKAYYVYAEGAEAYKQRLKAKAIEKMAELNKTILNQVDAFVSECQKSIDELQGLTAYANNLQYVYEKMLVKIIEKSNVTRLTDDIQNTTNRKTYYLNNSLARIMAWNTIFNAALVALSFTFLYKAGQTGNLASPIPWLAAVGTLVVSFVLVHILIWLQNLSTPLSSFSEWTPSDKQGLWVGTKLSDKFT
jgi:hypothetical protein